MIELCKKKKIDMILTKSISRFARNTLDCIQYVRMLKRLGIPVQFEKEGINTADMTSEMILTCLSSFAQAESESISLNVARGKRMGYKQGKFSFRYTNFLGYRKGSDGQPRIEPGEAKTIRTIYKKYLNSDSLTTIKEYLEKEKILTATGKSEWTTQSILRILQNEKYMGAVLLQKTFTADFLEGKIRKNNGELPQYYIENNHPAIVTKETFFQVQKEITRRNSKHPATQNSKTNRGKFTRKYALSERLVCGNCGCHYRRVTWNIHGRKEIVWRCINRLEFGQKFCPDSSTLPEDILHRAIIENIRTLVADSQSEIVSCLQNTLVNCIGEGSETDPTAIQYKIEEMNQEFDRLLLLAGEGESEFMDRRLKQVNDEILELKQLKKHVDQAVEQNQNTASKVKEIRELMSSESLNLTEYSDSLVYRIIEQITVISKEEIHIRLVGGYEISQAHR